MLRNHSFFCFTSFRIVSLTLFYNNPEPSRDLTIFITPSISSFEIISVVVTGPKIFLCIPASAAGAAAFNPNGIKTLSANETLIKKPFINGNPVFINGPRSLTRNTQDCIILGNSVFDNLILTDV